jgi:hypothetical protein
LLLVTKSVTQFVHCDKSESVSIHGLNLVILTGPVVVVVVVVVVGC